MTDHKGPDFPEISSDKLSVPELLKKLDRRGTVVAYRPRLVSLTGSVSAALMLSQALFWQRNAARGWFAASRVDWRRATGLTRASQQTARRALRELGGVWSEHRAAFPRKCWFHVSIDEVARRLQLPAGWDQAEQAARTMPSSRPGTLRDNHYKKRNETRGASGTRTGATPTGISVDELLAAMGVDDA